MADISPSNRLSASANNPDNGHVISKDAEASAFASVTNNHAGSPQESDVKISLTKTVLVSYSLLAIINFSVSATNLSSNHGAILYYGGVEIDIPDSQSRPTFIMSLVFSIFTLLSSFFQIQQYGVHRKYQAALICSIISSILWMMTIIIGFLPSSISITKDYIYGSYYTTTIESYGNTGAFAAYLQVPNWEKKYHIPGDVRNGDLIGPVIILIGTVCASFGCSVLLSIYAAVGHKHYKEGNRATASLPAEAPVELPTL